MKTLGLLRHASSDWDDLSLPDFERELNARGHRGAALMGQHIRAHGTAWDAVLASPAARVRRTLEDATLNEFARFDERLYLAGRESLLGVLRDLDDTIGAAMIAGHNPGLQELVFDLVAPEAENALFAEAAAKFPTGAFAVLELAIEQWDDLASGCGKLVHLTRPRDLDPELGPQDGR